MKEPSKRCASAMSVRQGIVAVMVFYAVLLALNAAALHESVQRQPFGPARTFWLSVTGPMAGASRALRLDRPRQFIHHTLGEALDH